MKILSLFDGMACGMLAFQRAGIPVEEYNAYEIDKYAIQTATHNFPNIKELGDVFNADFTQYKGVDFLIGGSPCTYWSIAQSPDKRETTASGMGWELFSQYVRALHEVQPKYFLYENNKSMAKAIYQSISETFGFEPIMINSALVSAQNRQRYYWVGKREPDGTYTKVDIQQPEDRGILLKDILEGGCNFGETGGKSYCLTSRYHKGVGTNPGKVFEKHRDSMAAEPVYQFQDCVIRNKAHITVNENAIRGVQDKNGASCAENFYEMTDRKANTLTTAHTPKIIDNIENYKCYAVPVEFDDNGEPAKAVSSADGKTYTVYRVHNGKITIKEKEYPIKLIDGYYIIRKLTVRECMRLQTVPEWYEFALSDTQAYKMLGNGWTVDVIAHILKGVTNA